MHYVLLYQNWILSRMGLIRRNKIEESIGWKRTKRNAKKRSLIIVAPLIPNFLQFVALIVASFHLRDDGGHIFLFFADCANFYFSPISLWSLQKRNVSVVSDGAAEEDATKRSPEVFVENGVNDLKSSGKRKIGEKPWYVNSINTTLKANCKLFVEFTRPINLPFSFSFFSFIDLVATHASVS